MTLVSFALSAACSHPTPRSHRDPEVVLRAQTGEHHVKVELARTDPERSRGLMYRQTLDDGRGMLFVFERSEHLTFWMKNTYIPLDMIFIDGDMRVVGIEENAEPLTLTARGPAADSQYVLEVPGGWARTHAVIPGTIVRFIGVD